MTRPLYSTTRLHFALAAAVAAACGGGSVGGGEDADAGPGGADAGGGLAIESIRPAAGATGVSVLAEVEVTLTGDADPAAVTADSVQLWRTSGGETRLFGAVEYDPETRTIALAPFDAFDHAATIELRLRGVAGPAGGLPDTAVSFSTTRNEWTRSTSYAADGVTVLNWSGHTFDADGYPVRYAYHNGAGDDADWYTDDDVVALRHDTTRDDQHRPTRVVTYSGVAQTLVQWTAITYDAAGDRVLEVNHGDPGDNDTWFDDDDVVVLRRVRTYDAGHRLLRGTQLDAGGVATFAEGFVYDADGLPVRRAVYAEPGDNGTWGDDDDVPDAWVEYQYSRERQLTRRVSHGGPGDDGDWFTADDPITSYVDHVRDDHGRPIRTVSHDGPGDDGDWFTSDDAVFRYDAFTPFARNLYAEDRYITSPGDNGTWFDGDDTIASLYVDTSADNGDLLREAEVREPGDDGDWATSDDPVSYLAEWTADPP